MSDEMPGGTVRCRSVHSTDLFGRGRTVTIRHGGDEYRLQITAANKLILTK